MPGLPDERRFEPTRDDATRDALERASRSLDSVETLLLAGAWAEAAHALASACRALSALVAPPDAHPADVETRVVALGVEPAVARAFAARLRSHPHATASDVRVGLELATAIEGALRGALCTPRGRARGLPKPLRAVGAVLGALALAFATFVLRTAPRASASGTFGEAAAFAPARAIDGDVTTEWLAPVGGPSWIEVQRQRPADLVAVRLVNSRHAPYDDRGAREVRVVAYAGDQSLGEARARLAPGGQPGDTARIRIAARDVDRVRVYVDSFWGGGAGLAEIRLEDAEPMRRRTGSR